MPSASPPRDEALDRVIHWTELDDLIKDVSDFIQRRLAALPNDGKRVVILVPEHHASKTCMAVAEAAMCSASKLGDATLMIEYSPERAHLISESARHLDAMSSAGMAGGPNAARYAGAMIGLELDSAPAGITPLEQAKFRTQAHMAHQLGMEVKGFDLLPVDDEGVREQGLVQGTVGQASHPGGPLVISVGAYHMTAVYEALAPLAHVIGIGEVHDRFYSRDARAKEVADNLLFNDNFLAYRISPEIEGRLINHADFASKLGLPAGGMAAPQLRPLTQDQLHQTAVQLRDATPAAPAQQSQMLAAIQTTLAADALDAPSRTALLNTLLESLGGNAAQRLTPNHCMWLRGLCNAMLYESPPPHSGADRAQLARLLSGCIGSTAAEDINEWALARLDMLTEQHLAHRLWGTGAEQALCGIADAISRRAFTSAEQKAKLVSILERLAPCRKSAPTKQRMIQLMRSNRGWRITWATSCLAGCSWRFPLCPASPPDELQNFPGSRLLAVLPSFMASSPDLRGRHPRSCLKRRRLTNP